MRLSTAALALATLLPVTSAGAQSADDTTRTIDALTACRSVTDGGKRLACFDGVAERISRARTSGDLLVVDRKQVVERKRRSFGLATPTGQIFGGGPEDRATEVKELTSTIRATAPASYARWNMQLANGSVWQNVEPLGGPPSMGAAITLKSAGFGGFRAAIAGGRPILVKRIR